MKLDYLNSIPDPMRKKFGEKKNREIKNHFIRPLCNQLIPKNEKDDDEVNLYIIL